MKNVLLIILILNFIQGLSQNPTDEVFFRNNGGKMTFYLNDVGDITSKSQAVYYRVAKLDSITFNYIDTVQDYYIDGQLAYEAFYSGGFMQGTVKAFFKNGNIKYTGFYKNSARDSLWVYHFNNGNIEKIIRYKDSIIYVQELYKKNGKNIFSNGNGNYSGTIIINQKTALEGLIKGKIVNGRMDGPWRVTGIFGQALDYFKDGEYIRSEYWGSNFPIKRQIYSITGFELHENVDLFKFQALPLIKSNNNVKLNGIPVVFMPNQISTSINITDTCNLSLKYKNSIKLNSEFNKDVTKFIAQFVKDNSINSFLSFIQFTVTAENRIENIEIQSNNVLFSNKFNEFFKSNNEFYAPRLNCRPINCNIYLCIYFNNGKLYIPQYQYGDLIFE